MASDVLRTGSDFDLDPYDGFFDDGEEPRLLRQHATDLLNLQRGEYPMDARFGMDWLGIRQRKMASPEALAEQVRRLLRTIPAFSALVVSNVSRAGRSVSMSLRGKFGRYMGTAEVLLGIPSADKPGANGVGHFYLNVR